MGIKRYRMEQKREKKPDRRVIKTKKAIRNAFAELLSQKSLNEITVKELAETADINRKTFYNYYSDIHQVMDEIENEMVRAFESALQENVFNPQMRNPYAVFSKLTEIISSDIDFYSHLLKADTNNSLLVKLLSALKNKAREAFADQVTVDEASLSLIIDYVAAGMMAVYQSWFISGCRLPIERISEQVSIITLSGISGMVASQ